MKGLVDGCSFIQEASIRQHIGEFAGLRISYQFVLFNNINIVIMIAMGGYPLTSFAEL